MLLYLFSFYSYHFSIGATPASSGTRSPTASSAASISSGFMHLSNVISDTGTLQSDQMGSRMQSNADITRQSTDISTLTAYHTDFNDRCRLIPTVPSRRSLCVFDFNSTFHLYVPVHRHASHPLCRLKKQEGSAGSSLKRTNSSTSSTISLACPRDIRHLSLFLGSNRCRFPSFRLPAYSLVSTEIHRSAWLPSRYKRS